MLLSLGRGLAPAGRGEGVDPPSLPGPFSGLLDALAAAPIGAYALRRLSGDYLGPCLRLRRASDDAELDFGFDAAGALDSTAIAAWLGGAAGHVATWYDQSGQAADLAQAAAARQPLYSASGINGLPSLGFVKAEANFLERPAFTALNVADPAWSSFFVHRHATAATGNASETLWTQAESESELTFLRIAPRLGSQDWAGVQIRAQQIEPQIQVIEASPSAYGMISSYQSTVISFGTQVTWRKNRAVIAGLNNANLNPANPLLADRFTLGCFNRTTNAVSDFFDGDLAEFILFADSLTDPDLSTIEDDLADAWGL